MNKFDGTLLVSDIDGTLIGADGLPQANVDAIAQYCAQGGRFAIASGRSFAESAAILRKITPNAPCVFNNGTEIFDCNAKKPLEQILMDDSKDGETAQVLRMFPEAAVLIYTPGITYVVQQNRQTEEHDRDVGVDSVPISVTEIPKQKYKLVYMAPVETIRGIKAYYAAHPDDRLETNRSDPQYFEVFPAGGNKGDGVRRLAKRFGIPVERCFTIGDFDNDVPMLSAVPHSATPENGSPAAKKAAEITVCACEQGAVADYIRHIGEILSERDI